jgi:hypothetical protein
MSWGSAFGEINQKKNIIVAHTGCACAQPHLKEQPFHTYNRAYLSLKRGKWELNAVWCRSIKGPPPPPSSQLFFHLMPPARPTLLPRNAKVAYWRQDAGGGRRRTNNAFAVGQTIGRATAPSLGPRRRAEANVPRGGFGGPPPPPPPRPRPPPFHIGRLADDRVGTAGGVAPLSPSGRAILSRIAVEGRRESQGRLSGRTEA